MFFFKVPKIKALATAPAMTATKYITGFSTTPITQIPPCGARKEQPNNIDNNPAKPEPTAIEGITRNGSAAAKGIAPSVMNDIPIIIFVGMA